jgi:hypothetical protein
MRAFSLLFVAQMFVGGSACATELAGAPDEPGAPEALDSAALASGVIVNGLQWADTAGNPIQAHGAGIVRSGAFYLVAAAGGHRRCRRGPAPSGRRPQELHAQRAHLRSRPGVRYGAAGNVVLRDR